VIFSKILCVGGYLPPHTVDNSEIEENFGLKDWIFERTGIKKRHIADESAVEMGIKALEDALKSSKLPNKDIDYLIVASNSNDLLIPGMAGQIQKAFGGKMGGIDMQAGCSGFIQAMEIADSMIRSESFSNIAIIGTERLSQIVDFKDPVVGPLFGDGAGAIVMGRTDEAGLIASYSRIQGEGYESLVQKRGKKLEMDGKAVFRFAVEAMIEGIKEVLNRAKMKIEDIDLIVPHQSNVRIIYKVAERLNVPVNKFQISIEDHANTAAASIALALKDAIDSKRVKDSNVVLTVGYGAGLGIAANIFKL
jgi:3-oxoacyl-[acyl-carrier-protein] synthase-3